MGLVFEQLLLSKDTIDRLSYKAGIEVKDEDTLCFAITSLLDMHDNQYINLKEAHDLMKKNGIKVV